ncbi:MAG: hypothetical protein ACRD29_22380 [Acidimicrobiales bacterium]
MSEHGTRAPQSSAGVPVSQPLLAATSPGGLAAELARWAAEVRADEAAAARSRERWLRQQAEEESSVAGVLCDLAERRVPVVVQTRTGRRHRATVVAVARDFCLLATEAGRELLVGLAAIATVRPEPGAHPPVGDRVVEVELGILDALVHLIGDRPRVLVVTSSGEHIAGQLRTVGRDVVGLTNDGEARAIAYVPAWAITEIVLV